MSFEKVEFVSVTMVGDPEAWSLHAASYDEIWVGWASEDDVYRVKVIDGGSTLLHEFPKQNVRHFECRKTNGGKS